MKKDLAYYLKLKYEMHIRFDVDDEAWFVSYSDLPGCLADGITAAEALRNAERVKKEWIKSAIDEGWEVPEPSPAIEVSGRLTFRPPKSIHKSIIERARTEGVSINQLVTAYVIQGLERADAKEVIKEVADEQINKCIASARIDWYDFQAVNKPADGFLARLENSWKVDRTIQEGDKEREGYKEPFNN